MVPATPYMTNSKAERVVFDRLKRAFSNDDGYTAYHSLNLTRHERKRFGEIDFLVCCPLGIYVLEVKGGRVSCNVGEWTFTDRNERSDTSREGPFKQAESGLHALVTHLMEAIPSDCIKRFSIGFGVLLPNCELKVTSSEWDPEQVCGERESRSAEHWLKRLFDYWRGKDTVDRLATLDDLVLVDQFIRPNFETVTPLVSQIDDALEQICGFTESQMLLVDSLEQNRQIICEGGAGTGKTLMAVELARRWTAEGQRVAIVCFSEWLKNFLQENYQLPGLVVSTIKGLRQQLQRNGIDKLDALIVDEGQDFMTIETVESLNRYLIGGLESGRWCMFWDVNNQSGFFDELQMDALVSLLSRNPQRVPLKRNCRNTFVILNKIKNSIGADMGVQGAGDGPAIREILCETMLDVSQAIDAELGEFLDKAGLSCGQISILTDIQTMPLLEPNILVKWKDSVEKLDEYSVRYFPSKRTSLATIDNFKGLENDAIIFVARGNDLQKYKNVSYVAMSRAKVVLSIIYMSSTASLPEVKTAYSR